MMYAGHVLFEPLMINQEMLVIIDELFVRCYGRFPQERERVETLAAVQAGAERKQALEDVFWALLNSPEFIFNH